MRRKVLRLLSRKPRASSTNGKKIGLTKPGFTQGGFYYYYFMSSFQKTRGEGKREKRKPAGPRTNKSSENLLRPGIEPASKPLEGRRDTTEPHRHL